MLAAVNGYLNPVKELLDAGASIEVLSDSAHRKESVMRLYICQLIFNKFSSHRTVIAMIAPEGMFESMLKGGTFVESDKEVAMYILDYYCNDLVIGGDKVTAVHAYDSEM